MREFIEKLEAAGELVRITKEIDWDMEAGAIFRRGAELKAPAILMENIKDYPGWRYIGNAVASFRRYAIMLGLPPDTHPREIMEEVERRIQNPIKPVIVGEGPCQEVVIEEKDVDLFMLPAPMVHGGDGGRYIGTGDVEVEKDPDTGWVNWGTYRRMIHDERHLGGLVLPYADVGLIFYQKYVPKGEPMPAAIVIGPGPIEFVVASTSWGVQVSEPEMAGALLGEPIELVKCKTIPLEVPAHSEVVLEAEIMPGMTVEEGPFGEYTGFRTSPRMPRNVFRVKCITYRKDRPMINVANMGLPIDDWDIIQNIGFGLRVKRALVANGIPVSAVNMVPEGCAIACVVGLKTVPYANIASQIADIVFGTRGPHMYIHHLFVVGPEVDPYNLMEVIHALNMCHPKRIQIREDETSNPLIPFLDFEERVWSRGAKAVYDCTWPVWWDPRIEVPPRVGFRTIYPKEIVEKVEKEWESYGFGK